jgi:hypothetical protein
MFASLIMPSYAITSFGEDCLPCHQSGITVSTNATGTIQVEINDSFWLEVSASGGVPRDMAVIWSNVSHNTYFSFAPTEVEDNRLNDNQLDTGKISALFKISAPNVEGNYAIKTYAASAQGRGGFVEVKVTVGAGGEIPRAPLEIILELLSTVVPLTFSGIAILLIALRVIAWRRIPGGAD